jgi:hypothetical protein
MSTLEESWSRVVRLPLGPHDKEIIANIVSKQLSVIGDNRHLYVPKPVATDLPTYLGTTPENKTHKRRLTDLCLCLALNGVSKLQWSECSVDTTVGNPLSTTDYLEDSEPGAIYSGVTDDGINKLLEECLAIRRELVAKTRRDVGFSTLHLMLRYIAIVASEGLEDEHERTHFRLAASLIVTLHTLYLEPADLEPLSKHLPEHRLAHVLRTTRPKYPMRPGVANLMVKALNGLYKNRRAHELFDKQIKNKLLIPVPPELVYRVDSSERNRHYACLSYGLGKGGYQLKMNGTTTDVLVSRTLDRIGDILGHDPEIEYTDLTPTGRLEWQPKGAHKLSDIAIRAMANEDGFAFGRNELVKYESRGFAHELATMLRDCSEILDQDLATDVNSRISRLIGWVEREAKIREALADLTTWVFEEKAISEMVSQLTKRPLDREDKQIRNRVAGLTVQASGYSVAQGALATLVQLAPGSPQEAEINKVVGRFNTWPARANAIIKKLDGFIPPAEKADDGDASDEENDSPDGKVAPANRSAASSGASTAQADISIVYNPETKAQSPVYEPKYLKILFDLALNDKNGQILSLVRMGPGN